MRPETSNNQPQEGNSKPSILTDKISLGNVSLYAYLSFMRVIRETETLNNYRMNRIIARSIFFE